MENIKFSKVEGHFNIKFSEEQKLAVIISQSLVKGYDIQQYLPANIFMIRMDGRKGNDGNEKDTEYNFNGRNLSFPKYIRNSSLIINV